MRITTALLSVIATAALVAGTAAPAGAATQTRTDEAGDTSEAIFGPAPQAVRDAADILTLRGAHGDGKLTFTFMLEDVGSSEVLTDFGAAARIVTPTGADYLAVLRVDDGEKQVYLTRQGQESDLECDGLVGRVFAARDQYVITVPRSCVRNPREVRFGGVASAFVANDVNPDFASDDARRDGSVDAEIRLGTRDLKNN